MKKNIKITNKVIAFITSTVLSMIGYTVVKKNKALGEDTFFKGDSVISTKNVNMRLDTSKESFKLGEVKKGTIVDRIISLNGFDLIKYNDKLVFVSNEFTNVDVKDTNNEYYKIEKDSDIIHTTTKVNFRLGPSTNEKKICLLDKDEELVVLGKSISYNDPEDIWYLAKYQDKIGFIKAEFTKSLKEYINSIDPSIKDVNIKEIGYLNDNSQIFDYQGSVIDNIEAYQVVKVLEDKGEYYLVEINNTIGLVLKNNVNTYEGNFVVVDLSDQNVCMYNNTDIVFKSPCTTGSDQRPTRVGAFSVYERTDTRYFSESAQSKHMWANFDHGNGLHDAPWEDPKKFGNEKFRKNNGSKGCVRLPDEAAIFLKKYVKKGTKVLVKK